MLAELPVKVLPLTVTVPTKPCVGRGRRRLSGGGVAGEGAVAHRHRPEAVGEAAADELAELPVKVLSLTVTVPAEVVEAAATEAGGVAGEGAVAHRHRRPAEVDEAAAERWRSCR